MSKEFPPISALDDIQPPESNFKKFTALDLFLIRVEMWKYLVLRYLHVNQVSLDFEHHRLIKTLL
jgi:hypothetical protein